MFTVLTDAGFTVGMMHHNHTTYLETNATAGEFAVARAYINIPSSNPVAEPTDMPATLTVPDHLPEGFA